MKPYMHRLQTFSPNTQPVAVIDLPTAIPSHPIVPPRSTTPAPSSPHRHATRFVVSAQAQAFRKHFFPDASRVGWNNWHWQLQNRIRDLATLEQVVHLSDDERRAIQRHRGSLPVGINPYYASLLSPDDPDQPGGDPLTLSDERLGWLLTRLKRTPHVSFVRLGTKVPMVLPQRITTELVRLLKRFHPLWIEPFSYAVPKGLELIQGLRGYTSGYAMPTLVVDAPGGGGKIPLQPEYVVGRDGDNLLLRNYEGHVYTYPDPGGTLGATCSRSEQDGASERFAIKANCLLGESHTCHSNRWATQTMEVAHIRSWRSWGHLR